MKIELREGLYQHYSPIEHMEFYYLIHIKDDIKILRILIQRINYKGSVTIKRVCADWGRLGNR